MHHPVRSVNWKDDGWIVHVLSWFLIFDVLYVSVGGPFVAASGSEIEDTTAAEKLFDLLAGDKEKLAKFYMGVQLKELAGGEQGLTWKDFAAAMGL